MGKKNKFKDDVPNPNSVSNRDIIQRLNFLYQASIYLNGLCPPGARAGRTWPGHPPPTKTVEKKGVGKEQKGKRKRWRCTTADLSRSYVRSMKTVAQRTTVKMDPTVKRTLCKGCSTVLLPGSTASVRTKPLPSHGHAVVYTCRCCGASRRIPAPPVLTISSDADHAEPPDVESEVELPVASTIQPPHETLLAMDIHGSADSQQEAGKIRRPKVFKKKKPPVPRLPPFFERNVGHVVFRGNQRLGVEPMEV